MSQALQRIESETERSLAETPVLSFMALLSMPRPRLLELGETLSRLPQPCRTQLTEVNLFSETTRMVDLYQRLPGDWSVWMGSDMDEIWNSFGQHSVNPREMTGNEIYEPAAESLTRALGEKRVTSKLGVEYVLAAGSKVIQVDRDLFCQDVLTIPTGARDPKLVVPSYIWTRPIIDSPLLVFPSRLGKEETDIFAGLIDSFVGTIAGLTEPMHVGIYPVSGGASLLELSAAFQQLSGLLARNPRVESTGYPDENSDSFRVNAFLEGKLVRQATMKFNYEEGAYVSPDLSGRELVRQAYEILEGRFLVGVRQVQEKAKAAAELMVRQLRERHQAEWKDGRAEMAVQLLAEIVYGTWVESLLLLWRTKFSNPVAGYLR